MNSQGRHYRDQTDVSVPICDYEAKGSKCDFFTASHEHNVMPYPTDISLGPVSTDSVAQNSDISAILNLLQEQKAESEKQAIQLQQLAQKVNNMSTHSPGTPARHTGTPTRLDTGPPVTTAPPAPVLNTASTAVTNTVTAPNVVSSAASALSAQLQSGLGHQHNLGYTSLTMDQLRADQDVLNRANRMLADSTRGVAPLNPLDGMGSALGTLGSRRNQVISVDELYAATTVNKQLRSFEFAATGQFPYKSQIKLDNCNATLFAYGSFKHLEAAKLGLV